MTPSRRTPAWRRYLRFWGSDPSGDLDDELRFHIEARYDEYLREGMDPMRARAEAERRFGDLRRVREQCAAVDSQWTKERTMIDFVSGALTDLRHAARQLRRNPALTVAAILCFALGIGANTSIFSVVDAVLFRPLPFPESDRLVLVGEELQNVGGGNFGLISTAEYSDYRQLDGRTFESSAIYENTSFTVTGSGEPERLSGAAVSASLFKVLRIDATLGRTFLPNEDLVGGPNVVVLSHSLWQRRYNGDRSVIGKTMIVNGVPSTIIGVMPAGFAFPLPGLGSGVADLFEPLWITPDIEKQRGNSYNTTFIARLAPGVTIESAKRAASDVAARLDDAHPGAYGRGHKVFADVFSLHERAVGNVRRSLVVLLAAVGFVLLIACINVSSLLVARAAARQRELSVRRALGASRARLVRQFLAESILLIAIGGALGLLLAIWGAHTLALRAPRSLLQGYEIGLNARVLFVTAGIATITAIVISLLPAFQHAETGLANALRDEGRAASAGAARQRGRRALVVSEIALAMIVATGAGLMIKSFLNSRNVDPGFDPQGLVSFRLSLNDYRYKDVDAIQRFERDFVERLRAIPGVSAATIATTVPMGGMSMAAFSIEHHDLPQVPTARYTIVGPDYFETLRISLRAGTAFTGLERRESPPVAIINETFARQLFGNTNPIGQHLKWGSPTSTSPWATIVGVAADVKGMALDAPQERAVYFPAAQMDTVVVQRLMRGMSYIVRTDGDAPALFNAIRHTVHDADPDLPIAQLTTVDDIVSLSGATRRFNTALLGMFALLALTLAAVGIYGLMAYAVVQRTREIGIRLAIGATASDVLRLVVGQATRVALIGVVIGVVGALMLTRIMTSLLFDVSPVDPVTFGASALALFAIAGLASYLPARRASAIDPQSAIRAD